MKKFIISILCSAVVVGFFTYEAYSIITNERDRQIEIMAQARDEINYGLDMTKIAVISGDSEEFTKNVEKVKEGASKLKPLFLVEREELIDGISEYVQTLESKVNLLTELNGIKKEISKLKDEFSSKYGNKDEITREKVKEAKGVIEQLKIDTAAFSEERIIAMAEMINAVIGESAGKVGALADCIDTCYRNRISDLNDELAAVFKSFSNNLTELNVNFEKEFDFGKMDELKKMYNEKEEENKEEEVEGVSDEAI